MNHVILIFVNLILVIAFWNLFWKRSQLCKFRDKMFEIRGKLFDLAINNPEFTFNSDLYLQFESVLNGTARYAFRIGFFDYVYFLIFVKPHYKNLGLASKFDEDFINNLERIKDEKVRVVLAEIKKDYELSIGDLLVFSSLILSAAFFMVLVVFVLREIIVSTLKSVSGLFKGLKLEFNPSEVGATISSCSDEISVALINNVSAHKIIIETEMEAELAQCAG